MKHELDTGIKIYGEIGDITDENERYKFFEGLAEYQKTQYKIQRKNEYPSIGDQLDALFHAGVFPADMAAKIQEIKNKYPKP
jgi:hypothetical protein